MHCSALVDFEQDQVASGLQFDRHNFLAQPKVEPDATSPTSLPFTQIYRRWRVPW